MDADKCFSYPRKSASSAVKILLVAALPRCEIRAIRGYLLFFGCGGATLGKSVFW